MQQAPTPQGLIEKILALIEKIIALAADDEAPLEALEEHMHTIEDHIKTLKTLPEWHTMRDDIMGLSNSLAAMQTQLTAAYNKAKNELTTLEKRSQAEKAYAAYTQPKNTPQGK